MALGKEFRLLSNCFLIFQLVSESGEHFLKCLVKISYFNVELILVVDLVVKQRFFWPFFHDCPMDHSTVGEVLKNLLVFFKELLDFLALNETQF